MEQEQAPAVQNKGLLITALVLGLLVVLLYNWHISEVRKAGIGDTVMLLVARRSLDAGEKLDPKDLKIVYVETHFRKGLGSNVVSGVSPEEVKDEVLSRGVQRDRFLRWGDITGHEDDPKSGILRKGMEAFTLNIETNESPGQMLRQGDRIVVIGTLAVKGRAPKSYRIIEGVKVVSVGGLATVTGTGRSRFGGSSRAMRSYRSIGIQVDAETAVQLHNVVPLVIGNLRVNVLSPKDKGNKYVDPIPINKELKDVEPYIEGGGGI